jgi:K+-transporting ATPase ATPase A chain
MTANGILQVALYFIALVAAAVPLGRYMARVYAGETVFLSRLAGPLEKWIYRCCRISAEQEMSWKAYAGGLLIFNLTGCLAVYLLQRLQGFLPFNPYGFAAVPPDLAFNTAVSFATNTNWQAYGGETTMSFFTQMAGLAVQNFASAASGMAVLLAFIRGLKRTLSQTIGNVWVDLTRSIIYILLPLSLVMALFLVSQGVVQTLQSPARVQLLEQTKDEKGHAVSGQEIPLGPAASQVAIKQLGTNGGGFFNANSAHPLENPTPLSNFAEMLAILLIPGGALHHLRQNAGGQEAGMGTTRRHDGDPHTAAGGLSVERTDGEYRFSADERRSVRRRPPIRWKHGRQGGPVRHREFRSLGRCDNSRLQRERQRHA